MSEVNVNKAQLVHGHIPLLRPQIVINVPRPPSQLVERFQKFAVPDLSDAVGELYTNGI